ncbi:MAG: hypothetical protein QXP27_05300 [Candidatus Methanomethyliaceae archaeon]
MSEPPSIGKAIKNKRLIFKDWVRSFSPESFDVSFSDVIAGRGNRTYLDPDELFANTYLTGRMREVIKWTLARAAGISGKGVIHLATGFGGGKSHLLAVLYHIFKSRKVPDPQILKELALDEVPEVELVAADGHDLSYPLSSSPLGRFARGTKEESMQVLASAGKPVVILLDEFVVYLAKLGEKSSQELAHLHTLIEAVKSTDRCAIVVTSPSGSAAYGKESEMLDSVIRKSREQEEASKLAGILGRVSEPVVPVEAGDFIAIAKKRLTELVDDYTAATVEQYMGRIVRDLDFHGCYPFHPLLKEVLYNRVSLFPGFQRTRDSLKIVALAAKWAVNRADEADFLLISPSEVPLFDPDAKSILTNDKVFGVNLEQAVTRDVIEKALEVLDGKRHYGINSRIATAVFMYSLHPEVNKRGALPDDVFRCAVPEVKSKEDAEQRLRLLQEKSDHMWQEGGRFLFKPKQNVPNMIRARANLVTPTEVTERIKKEIYRTVFASSNGCEFYHDPNFFEPVTNKLNILVIMPWGDVEKGSAAALNLHLERKNSCAVLIPSEHAQGTLVYNAKMSLGAERVMKEIRSDKEVYEEAKMWKDKYEADAVQAMRMMYTRIRYLRGTRTEEVQFDPSRGNTLAEAVMDELRRRQKLANPDTVDPKTYMEELMGQRDSARVRELFKDVESLTTIPFAFREDLLRILSAGVKEGVVGAVEGELMEGEEALKRTKVHYKEDYRVSEGDTILSPKRTLELLEAIRRILEVDKGGKERGEGEEKTEGAPTGEVVIGGKGPGIEKTAETIMSDIKDLSRLVESKITELMIKRVDYAMEIEFSGAISGRITAKTPEELSAVRTLLDSLSKAHILLPSVKAAVTITKFAGRADQ